MTGGDDGPLRRALEVLVYAPIGAVVEARRLCPGLAEAGRDRIVRQVGLARVIGEFAVRAGRGIIEQRFSAGAGRVDPRNGSPATVRQTAPAPLLPAGGAGIDPDSLAIADYDSLAASQIVACLAGLPRDDLDRIARYEAAHRARRTVLGQIARLEHGR